MIKAIIRKRWWVPLLAVFDFIYYYFIQHLVTQKTAGRGIDIKWEGVFFVFIISLISIWCVRLIKGRVDKLAIKSIPVKYFQILIYSFVLFIGITAGGQFLIEFAAGQQRTLEYIIGNAIVYVFLHVIVGNAYIAVEYFRESATLKQDLIMAEKAKAESELKILQQQMSPHFLFNNLNTLASLIAQDKNKAISFTRGLSDIFRHLSQTTDKELVTLREELDFLSTYMELLNFRFGEAYVLYQNLESVDPSGILAIPMALQTIIENVIKHNSGSRSNPLKIELYINGDCIEVRNEIRMKKVSKHHESGIGLKNLQDRYQLVTGRGISYQENDGYFIVKLPLIKSIDDESLDH